MRRPLLWPTDSPSPQPASLLSSVSSQSSSSFGAMFTASSKSLRLSVWSSVDVRMASAVPTSCTRPDASLRGSPRMGRPKANPTRGVRMSTQETGQVTGTKDKDYNVIWFTEQCLSNVLRLETYIEDAERDGDSDLAEFFRRAQGASRKGAEEGKQLLAQRLS